MLALNRRTALGFVLALAPLAARAGAEDKPPPAFRFADADRCSQGSYFFIHNAGRLPILEIYLRLSATSGWGSDLLGDAVLPAEGERRLDPGQGVYDLLLLREDGRGFTAMRQNACRITHVTLDADGRIAIR